MTSVHGCKCNLDATLSFVYTRRVFHRLPAIKLACLNRSPQTGTIISWVRWWAECSILRQNTQVVRIINQAAYRHENVPPPKKKDTSQGGKQLVRLRLENSRLTRKDVPVASEKSEED